MIIKFDKELDVRGLYCPLPILKTKKILANMNCGEILRIITTDTNSVQDFQCFTKQTGNNLLFKIQANKEFIFFIKRK